MTSKEYSQVVESKQDFYARENLFPFLRKECGAEYISQGSSSLRDEWTYHLDTHSLTAIYSITKRRTPHTSFHSGRAILRIWGNKENIGEFDRLLEAAEQSFKKSPKAKPSAPDGF
jgi:hypothetical protein